MANKTLFKSIIGRLIPQADTRNEAGGKAYQFPPRHQLAQYAATGCFNSTYYASDEEQLEKTLKLCAEVDPEFIAKTAVYCRERGRMKDMPALLCAALTVHETPLLETAFGRVIDNGKMLRNFVQIMRSGVLGRKSLGSRPRRLVRQWLESRTDEAVFRSSVGQSPSLADVVKMVHPKPATPARDALYGYLLDREHDALQLPKVVRHYEDYKAGKTTEVPDVPFQMLTSLELGTPEWTEIARNASWQMTRMNLNTFARHGVFKDRGMTKLIADRLRDPFLIEKAKVFPYQLMVAYHMVGKDVPNKVREALQDAMEIAINNVPEIDGQVYVCVDVSGSMSCSVTGFRRGSTSAVRCVDVAALIGAAILRKNPNAEVIPFEHEVVKLRINPRDSVMTNAKRLSSIGGGGTAVSAPLEHLNRRRATGDMVIYVSDNESWADPWSGRGTATLSEWKTFKSRNPAAKLVCIDIQPYGSTQAQDAADVLNIGGFSDAVFDVIAEFAKDEQKPEHWVNVIQSVRLES